MNAVTSMPKNVEEEAGYVGSRQMAPQKANFHRDHDDKPLDGELIPCFLLKPDDHFCWGDDFV